MTYKISYTKRFQKHYKRFTKLEKKQIKSKVEMLSLNPCHPSLRAKRIQGTDELFECSVNMDIRIIWYYEDDELIMLLDVGHHNILNKIT
ncbi:MAG: type II toxin-antitoxin system RelE/ParE family toxin [Eggerthellaceae bacterium]|nr:type II toxin-antitoxin system RelE/ParE family toxin [Eggerthellaceae bacterium]